MRPALASEAAASRPGWALRHVLEGMSLWTCLIALVACAETWEASGRQVRVEADAGLEMCGGTLEHLDRFVERFAGELGLPLAGEPWIDFRWMTPEHLRQRNPCAGAPACAVVRTVYASEMPHEHEIVHSAASDLGLAHPFFIEGLAVAFEAGAGDREATDDALDDTTGGDTDGDDTTGDDTVGDETNGGDEDEPPRVLEVLREGWVWLPGQYYPLAGAFTRYLIDRFGLRQHLEFYRRTWYADPYAALAREFRAVFGVTLEEVVTDFEAERADCEYTSYRFKLLECEAPELAWDGERLARYLTVDCDDAEAVGEAGKSARIWRTFEVKEGGRFRLEARDAAWTTLTLASCGGCERQAVTRLSLARARAEVELPPGRYFLRAESRALAPATVGLVMERVRE